MEQNEKPYQSLAWLATGILIIAAALASFVPELEYHHWAFISANTLWVYVGWLWKEQSLVVLNAGLTLIYIFCEFSLSRCFTWNKIAVPW